MSFGDEARSEEEPVSSEGEAPSEEKNGQSSAHTGPDTAALGDAIARAAAPEGRVAHDSAQTDDRDVLARERDEYLLALQRTQADFENYRKRIARQQEEQAARASQHVVDKLLPVLDALDLAENHLKDSLDVSEGAKALHASRAMLLDILSREGLERVDQPEVPFDPSVHDGVAHADGEGGPVARRWWTR
jgi:molecular chaperone GrpE